MSSPEQRFHMDGLAVYDRPSEGDALRVVIVHGGMDRASSFGRLARSLKGVSVRRYDRRGYGRSEPGTAVDLQHHVDDLLTVTEDRPAVIFGHSIGGTIALTAAAQEPTRFLGLLVYESPVPWIGSSRRSSSASLLDLDPQVAAERFMVAMAGERIWNKLPSETRAARRSEGAALQADLAIADGTPRFDPSNIRMPVLVGVGSKAANHRRTAARELASALPDGRLVEVEGADHGIHLRDPESNARLIRDLLDIVADDPTTPDDQPGDTVRP